MSALGTLKPLPVVACRNCNLYTPEWRGYCIHCGRPVRDRFSARSPKARRGGSRPQPAEGAGPQQTA